jgi:hypothetical protein
MKQRYWYIIKGEETVPESKNLVTLSFKIFLLILLDVPPVPGPDEGVPLGPENVHHLSLYQV